MVILAELKTKLKGYKKVIKNTANMQKIQLLKSEAVYEYVVLPATGAVNWRCFDYR